MDLRALLLPEPRRRLPHARAWNVGARTVHLGATGVLVGGHFFGIPADTLLPWLYAAIASGAVMFAVELYSSFDWLTELGGLAVVLKLALLAVVPFAWSARVPLAVRRRGRGGHRLPHAGQVPALLAPAPPRDEGNAIGN